MSNIPAPRGKRGDVSRIPPEILSEIFGHCLVDFASQDTRQLLSSVCSLWRALVLATPALWASLDITCDGDILRPPLPVIRTHLQRSRTHTLAFRICTRSNPFYSSDPSLLTALTALADARQRWRKVDITLFGMTQEILNLIVSGDTPLLQSIQCNEIAFQGYFPIPIRILRRCPRLEYFHWNSISSPLLLPVAVTQLTSLSLQTALSVSECITLLHLSPQLSSAWLYNITPGSSTTSPLTHPTLRAFTAGSEHFPGLLASLTLPALLELNLVTGLVKWDTELSTFLARGNPTLRHLSLTTQRARGHVFVLLRILALTPHLRSLELSGSASDSAPFTATLIRRCIHRVHLKPPCAHTSRD
ncbi:hypothetical protein BD779DRAFT_1670122 [Infundibulicybe gibba]|nr:hypothetical protein BD779DRAFT_1670122 [Infundibulicybe gibba]